MAPKRRLSGSCVGSDPWETLFKDHWKQCTDNGLPPWELGPYGHLDYNSTVDPLGLLQCQALLRLLFTHCPTGIVNHLALRGPLQNIATQCKGVDRTDEWWSDWLACKLRIAMAHVRRLKLLPKVYAQRVRGLTAGQKATLDEILALYHPTEKSQSQCSQRRGGQWQWHCSSNEAYWHCSSNTAYQSCNTGYHWHSSSNRAQLYQWLRHRHGNAHCHCPTAEAHPQVEH